MYWKAPDVWRLFLLVTTLWNSLTLLTPGCSWTKKPPWKRWLEACVIRGRTLCPVGQAHIGIFLLYFLVWKISNIVSERSERIVQAPLDRATANICHVGFSVPFLPLPPSQCTHMYTHIHTETQSIFLNDLKLNCKYPKTSPLNSSACSTQKWYFLP